MSNAVYPTLPGLAYKVKRVSGFKTQVHETASGREYRSALMVYPRDRYTLQYEFLRDRNATDEMRTLLGFYRSRRGAYDSFLLNDPDDNAVSAQAFGTGDGTTKTFQLVRTLGGFVEPVYDLNGAPAIYKAGVLQGSGYTVSATGAVTFTTAPAAGAVLTWTGSYYWRVRFVKDDLELEKFMNELWSGTLELKVVKP